MVTDVDWTLLMEKLDAIDKRLNTLEKEVKELKPIPVSIRYDITKERKDEP